MTTVNPNLTARSSRSNDYASVNEAALCHFDALMEELLPDGEYKGKEYLALNPHRDDYELGSFSINSTTGVWCDFADEHPDRSKHPASGGDLISLVAYVHQHDTQPEARSWLEGFVAEQEETQPTVADRRSHRTQTAVENASTLVVPVPDSALPVPTSFRGLGTPSRTWRYRDESGHVLGYILRFETAAGKKEIRPLTYHVDKEGRGGWEMKAFPDPRPLYNLDLLAANGDAGVVLVEGEKSADAAAMLFPGRIAMTVQGGANAVGKTDLTPLAGRDVLIWPDADEPGHRYAEELAAKLLQLSPAATVKVMKPITQYAVADGQKNPLLLDGFTVSPGWDAADAVELGWTAAHVALLSRDAYEERLASNATIMQGQSGCIKTCHGIFDRTATGIYYVEPREKTEFRLWLCGPLTVVARTRSGDSTQWGVMLRFQDHDNRTHDLVIPAESLQQDGWRKELLNRGFNVGSSPMAREKLIAYLMSVPVEGRVLCFDKIGWHDDVFLLPEQAFGQSETSVVLQDEGRVGTKLYTQSNSLEGWQRNVASLCEGNSRLTLAVCAALAGPFLHRLGLENGGFHFRGNSSIGKTITLQVAGSVWGGTGFIRRWRATANGLEAISLAHNDTVLLLDEMSQVPASEVGEIAYMLGNGQGKARAKRSGGAAAASSWRFLFLSTGEVNLSNHLSSVSKRAMAGQETRLLDIPADTGKGFGIFDVLHGVDCSRTLAEQVKSNASQHYGTAGPALLERLTQSDVIGRIEETVFSLMRVFAEACGPDHADGQVLRALNRFALAAAVGEFCIQLGVLPWQPGNAVAGVRQCFDDWLHARGGEGNLERDQIVAQATGLIERFGESRFTDVGTGAVGLESGTMQSRSHDRLGFKAINGDGEYEYFVLAEPFKSSFCQGFHPADVVRVLAEEGMLIPGRDGTTHTKRFGEYGQSRVYLLKGGTIASSQEEESDTANS